MPPDDVYLTDAQVEQIAQRVVAVIVKKMTAPDWRTDIEREADEQAALARSEIARRAISQ